MTISGQKTPEKGEEDALLDCLRPAVEALAELHHSGKVHGRISPDTVLVTGQLWFPLPTVSQDRGMLARKKRGRPYSQPGFARDKRSGREGNPGQRYSKRRVYTIGTAAGRSPRSRFRCVQPVRCVISILTGTKPTDVRSRILGEALKKPTELGANISCAQENALMKGLDELAKNRHKDGTELCQALYGKKSLEKQSSKRCHLRNGWTVRQNIADARLLERIIFTDRIYKEAKGRTDVSEEKNGTVMAWTDKKDGYSTLYIGSEGGVKAGTSCCGMFSDCENLKEISFQHNFDTKDVTDMDAMFDNCKNLISLDIENLDTSGTTNMSAMFRYCSNLRSLDVSRFDTSNVTNMSFMFDGCERLSSLDVSGFDTSNATNMSYMFNRCKVTDLDVSGFNTSNVRNMKFMFSGCVNLRRLNISKFDTSHVTDMSGMFWNCENLIDLNVSGFDTSHVTDMSRMFCNCKNLTNLNVSGFNTSHVVDMNCMFRDCYNLKNLDVSGFDTSHVRNMKSMFSYCTSLEKLDIRHFDMIEVEDWTDMLLGTFKNKEGKHKKYK